MNSENIQDYIYEHIPIIAKNSFEIQKDSFDMIYVKGKLKDHINHRNSVFGGSLSTALIVSSWANVRNTLLSRNIDNGIIVIQSQKVEFIEPVNADFIAITRKISEEKIAKFVKILNKFGKSRLIIESIVTYENSAEILATFTGEFVVVIDKKA